MVLIGLADSGTEIWDIERMVAALALTDSMMVVVAVVVVVVKVVRHKKVPFWDRCGRKNRKVSDGIAGIPYRMSNYVPSIILTDTSCQGPAPCRENVCAA